MSILVVGSVALDSVETPFGKAEDVLGGSATYFSVAASFFTNVNLVAVTGEDFPREHIEFLKTKPIDIEGLKNMPGKTFRWQGRYGYDLNNAETLSTCLNVFKDFSPKLPPNYCDSNYIFLANIDPELQTDVLNQIKSPRLVACDTMNFWIRGKSDALKETLKRVDVLIINEAEARELSQEANLIRAARKIFLYGPRMLVVKRGEYGVLLFNGESIFTIPAFPLEYVFDPTGAGDSFAGGFMGYLASCGNIDDVNLRKAIIFGNVVASFTVEDFSLNRLKTLNSKDIEKRYSQFKKLTCFE